MTKSRVTLFILPILSVGIIWFAPSLYSRANERYLELQIFTKVLNLVQQYYVEDVDTKKLIYGGVKGMLSELDPHTNFLPPELYKEFQSEASGEFGGLGIEITIQDGILTVISPIEDTPAWEAGIKAGDKIITIDGEPTKGLSLAEAAQKMRGKRGETIKLGIFRDGFEEAKVYSIKRGTVKIRSAKYTDIEEGYAYIRMTHFIENSSEDLKKAIEGHRKKHGKISGLILDLRRNPGGLLNQAVQVSDLFLNGGKIVSTVGKNKNDPEILYARREGTLENFPMIILIDEFSASASEIVAGALQDNKRALVLGQRSFGKGSVQSVVNLGDGSGLKLTVARYYTPSGRSIQAEGIQPDVEIANLSAKAIEEASLKTEIRREKDISGHLEGDTNKEGKDVKRTPSPGILGLFWSRPSGDEKSDQTDKDRLLGSDFQVLQAYNYLKAFSLMGASFQDLQPTDSAPQ